MPLYVTRENTVVNKKEIKFCNIEQPLNGYSEGAQKTCLSIIVDVAAADLF